MRTRTLAACLLPVLLITTAGCTTSTDGARVASAGSSAAPNATAGLTGPARAIRYAQCMREHGVPMTDPEVKADGIRAGTYDKDAVDLDTVHKAEEACKQYQADLNAPERAAKVDMQREYSRCMRANGVENFPDPDASGRITLPQEQTDPDYERAKAICDAQTRSAWASSPAAR